MTKDRYRFVPSSTPYAWVVVDNHPPCLQVEGSVTRDIGGGFNYQRGRWNGEKQVFDYRHAMSLSELSQMIDEYLNPKS